MKKLVSFGFLSVAFAFAMSQASAGLLVNINFDEFGNGTTDFPSTTLHAMPSALVADPSGGVTGSVLAYQLPLVTVQGDVILNEVIGATVVVSDVVRFFTVGNTGFVLFYSDNGDGVDAPADISGLPVNALTNVVTIQEIGPEGANGAIYTPTAGQPGYVSTDFSPTYNIISDSAVPEPGSVLLIAAGLGGLGLLKRVIR